MVFPYPTNMSGLGSIMVYSNTITNGMFGTVMMGAFCAVMFMTMGANDRALMTAGFTSLIMSLFMSVMGIVDSYVIMVFLALTIAGMIWNWTSN